MKTIVSAMFVAGLLLLRPAMSFAQGVSGAELSQYVYTYGTIISVHETKITLQEYDYDSDEEKEMTYLIDAQTKLEGVGNLKQLEAGDVVELYYFEQDGKLLAKVIRKETVYEEGKLNGSRPNAT